MKEPFHNRDSHLHIEQIDGLVAAAGADGAREIIEAFQRSTSELLASLRGHIGAADYAAAAAAAHAIKGSAANVGGKRLAQTASRIEQACRDGAGAGASDALEDAQQDYEQFTLFFNEHLNGA